MREGRPKKRAGALASPISRTAAKALGLVELTTLPLDEAAERIEMRTRRYASYQRKWMRRIPGIELVRGRPARRGGGGCRSSTWHALGNTYRVVEPESSRLDAARAAELAAGTDGVLEVLATTASSVDIAIWNPDGSQAELSGNGTRIAAAWLAERTGATEVTVNVGSRRGRDDARADGRDRAADRRRPRRPGRDRRRDHVRAGVRRVTRTQS